MRVICPLKLGIDAQVLWRNGFLLGYPLEQLRVFTYR